MIDNIFFLAEKLPGVGKTFLRDFLNFSIVIFVLTVLPLENISSWSNNKPFEQKLCNSIWIFCLQPFS